jgi:LEA14-like dessication related protein
MRIAVLMATAISLWIAGCSSLPKVEKPGIRFSSLSFEDPTLTEATLRFELLVENPNPFQLAMSGLDYELRMGGKDMAKGALDRSMTIPAGGRGNVGLPIRVRYADVFGSLAEMARLGKSPYEIRGSLRSGLLQVPFAHSGEARFPELGGGGLRLRR